MQLLITEVWFSRRKIKQVKKKKNDNTTVMKQSCVPPQEKYTTIWCILMLPNCGAGEDSWEPLGLQGDPTSPSQRRSVLGVHWKDWCWSWNSNTFATCCKELTHWKISWCWERLKARGEGDTEVDKLLLVGKISSVQFSHSVMSDSLRPHDSSTPGFAVLHHLSEFAQIYTHWVTDAI